MRDKAVRLALKKVPREEIARRLGTTTASVKVMLTMARRAGVAVPYDPKATRKPSLQYSAAIPQHRHVVTAHYWAVDWRDRAEMERRRREVPEDTRDLTAQLCGDPLPGRSAADQEHRT